MCDARDEGRGRQGSGRGTRLTWFVSSGHAEGRGSTGQAVQRCAGKGQSQGATGGAGCKREQRMHRRTWGGQTTRDGIGQGRKAVQGESMALLYKGQSRRGVGSGGRNMEACKRAWQAYEAKGMALVCVREREAQACCRCGRREAGGRACLRCLGWAPATARR